MVNSVDAVKAILSPHRQRAVVKEHESHSGSASGTSFYKHKCQLLASDKINYFTLFNKQINRNIWNKTVLY